MNKGFVFIPPYLIYDWLCYKLSEGQHEKTDAERSEGKTLGASCFDLDIDMLTSDIDFSDNQIFERGFSCQSDVRPALQRTPDGQH